MEKEVILSDQTGEVYSRARDAGSVMAQHQHRFIIETITDTARNALGEATSTALYFMDSARTVYSTDHSAFDAQTNVNLSASSAIGDTDNWDKMWNYISQMKDLEGNYIATMPKWVLTSPLKARTALQFVANGNEPDTANNGINV